MEFALRFKEAVIDLWSFENGAQQGLTDRGFRSFVPAERKQAVIHQSCGFDGYAEARNEVSRSVLKALRLADRLGVPHVFQSWPVSAVGGPVIKVELFHGLPSDTSHGGTERHMFADAIDQLVGTAEDEF